MANESTGAGKHSTNQHALPIERLPDNVIPIVQFLVIVLCFCASFVVFRFGVWPVRGIMSQTMNGLILSCFVATFLMGYVLWHARVAAALSVMIGKDVVRLLLRLLWSVFRSKTDEPDTTLVERLKQALPGDKEAQAFLKAYLRAAKLFWISALPWAALAFALSLWGGGGLLGALSLLLACLIYSVFVSWVARQGLLIFGGAE